MTAPCRCPGPNESCRRAGVAMLGYQWELCSGKCPPERPCTKEQSEWWRAFWDGEVQEPMPEAPAILQSAPVENRTVCIHRGDPTGETGACHPCGGNVRIKLFGCTVHQKCTLAKVLDGFACCQTCPDYHAA